MQVSAKDPPSPEYYLTQNPNFFVVQCINLCPCRARLPFMGRGEGGEYIPTNPHPNISAFFIVCQLAAVQRGGGGYPSLVRPLPPPPIPSGERKSGFFYAEHLLMIANSKASYWRRLNYRATKQLMASIYIYRKGCVIPRSTKRA